MGSIFFSYTILTERLPSATPGQRVRFCRLRTAVIAVVFILKDGGAAQSSPAKSHALPRRGGILYKITSAFFPVALQES